MRLEGGLIKKLNCEIGVIVTYACYDADIDLKKISCDILGSGGPNIPGIMVKEEITETEHNHTNGVNAVRIQSYFC